MYAASESLRSVQIFCSRVCVCAMVPPFETIASETASAKPRLFLMAVPLQFFNCARSNPRFNGDFCTLNQRLHLGPCDLGGSGRPQPQSAPAVKFSGPTRGARQRMR